MKIWRGSSTELLNREFPYTLQVANELITLDILFRPTIFKNVSPAMEISLREESGPIPPIIAADNEDDAMMIANDSKFGLGAVCLWTAGS